MRTLAKVGAGFSAVIMALTVAACGGGGSQTSTNSATKPGASTAASASRVAAIPSTPVCSVISQENVSSHISMPVYAANDNDILAGAQPTLCDYYTNTDQTEYVEIHWMTKDQALWDTQMANLGTSESGGLTTTSAKDTSLGDDAIRSTAKSDMVTTTEYQVLLKPGFVLDISNCSEPSLSDGAFYKLVQWVVQTLDKL